MNDFLAQLATKTPVELIQLAILCAGLACFVGMGLVLAAQCMGDSVRRLFRRP